MIPKTFKIKPMRVKSIHMKPIVPFNLTERKPTTTDKPNKTTQPISITGSFGPRKKVLPDAGNQPDPTQKQLNHYRENRESIVSSIVKRSLRNNPKDVLHGSRSLKMLLPQYSRNPGDWDLLSPQEKKRALALERAIDRRVGADIAETRYMHIPKTTMGPEDPKDSKELYQVVTPRISNDADIDVMDRPPSIKTQRNKGITHETLEEQHHKAVTRQSRQPFKAQKALSDQHDIEQYWKSKGKKPPKVKKKGPFRR